MGHSEYENQNILPMIYMIHMPVFFVVSGYLFNANKPLKKITKSNVKGLLIPYILFNLLFATYWTVIGVLKVSVGQAFDWSACLINPAYKFVFGIALGNFDGPTWFLLALIWCKYMTYLLHNGKKYQKLGVVALWMVLFYVRIRTGQHFIFALDCACAGVVWFEAGQIVRRNKWNIKVPAFMYLLCVLIGFVACYYFMKTNGMCNYILADMNGVIGVFGSACGLVAFFSLCKLLSPYSNSFIVLVSKASIVIMCLHMMINVPLNRSIHYWNHSLYTFSVDFLMVIVLALVYPLIKRYAPAFVGGR